MKPVPKIATFALVIIAATIVACEKAGVVPAAAMPWVSVVVVLLGTVAGLLGVPLNMPGSSTTTTVETTGDAPKPPSKPPAIPLGPAVALLALSMLGCGTAKQKSYETLTVMASAVKVAAAELEPACKARGTALITAAKDKPVAQAGVVAVMLQCDAAATGLVAAQGALAVARNTAVQAPAAVSSATIADWLSLAVNLYRGLVPVLAPLGVMLPGGF